MKEKYFVWLLDSGEPVHGSGPKLVKGKIHKVGDYPLHVVEEWVKTKAAKYVKGEPEKEKE